MHVVASLSGAYSPRSPPNLANCPRCSRSPPTLREHDDHLSHASSR
jgi:hypothetical protein